jgi:hypothetical protein
LLLSLLLDQVRERTKRRVPLTTTELIANLNPVVKQAETQRTAADRGGHRKAP